MSFGPVCFVFSKSVTWFLLLDPYRSGYPFAPRPNHLASLCLSMALLDPTPQSNLAFGFVFLLILQPKVVAGYVSDGAASDGSAPGDFGAPSATVGDKSRALAALSLSQSSGGGTFSGSYERLPSWGEVEAGAAGGSGIVPRSISVNSDGGGYGAAGTRSLSVNSDVAPGTDRECGNNCCVAWRAFAVDVSQQVVVWRVFAGC